RTSIARCHAPSYLRCGLRLPQCEHNRVVFGSPEGDCQIAALGRTLQPVPGRRLVLTVIESNGGIVTNAQIGDELVVSLLDFFAAIAVLLLCSGQRLDLGRLPFAK